MSDINIKVDNIYSLISLQKILHTAKFYEDLDESYTLHASEWSNLIIDELVSYYLKEGDYLEYDRWKNWRKLDKTRLEYKVISDRLKKVSKILKNPTKAQIIQIIGIYTSPFVFNKDIYEILEKIIVNGCR